MPLLARTTAVLSRTQTVFLRLIGSVLQMVLSILVARWGGAAVLGEFLVFVAIVNLAVSVGSGLPNLMLRHASTSTGGVPHTGWLWRTTLVLVGLSVAISAGALLLGGEHVMFVAIGVGGLLLQRVSSSTVKAAERPGLGVLLDTALWPFLVTVQTVAWHLVEGRLTSRLLSTGYVVGVLLAALVAMLVCRGLPSSAASAFRIRSRPDRAYYVEILVVTVGAFASAVSVNAPLALAPFFLSASETGRLGLALRVAGFATTILVSLAAHFSPLFARARTRGELLAYRRQSQLASVALYLPVLLSALALPTDWLRWLGGEFTGVKPLVIVLAVGYLLNAATGLTPQLMLMRGRSRDYSRVHVVSAVATVAGVVPGGWLGGEIGLCIGLSVAMAATNAWGFLVSDRAVRAAPVTAAPDTRAARAVP